MTMISNTPLISSIYDRLLVQDDTEESVSGSDYHLMAILALYDVLLRFSQRMARHWYVTAEVLVLADVPDRDRNPWRPMPDVYVVVDAEQVQRISYDVRTGLPFPQFICEVASDSTWDEDVSGKQRLYADLGTQEYIVFDPTQEYLGESVRAWHRRADGSWGRWEADAEGFLTSRVLELRFRAEETLLRAYDPDQGLLLLGEELDQLARERAQRIADIDRRLTQAKQQLVGAAQQLAQANQQRADVERKVKAQGRELERERARRRELEEQLARFQQERPHQ
jgi:Uma2 family endonuclease